MGAVLITQRQEGIKIKMRKRAKQETPFMKNGRRLLEELIASCDGKCNPIRSFSAKDLQKATNSYDSGQLICEDLDYKLYKGFLEDRPISVKKYMFLRGTSEYMGSPFTDVVVGSQMSSHKNVLKLIGCCLESEHPILVHEFAGCETLSRFMSHHPDQIQSPPTPSWKSSIKIAVDVANALAYLHTALSKRVIHRDITPAAILMDVNYVAKLIDFSLAIAIPDGGLDLVSHFKNSIARDEIEEILDPAIVAEGPWPGKERQLNDFIDLALRCANESAEERPAMMEVGKELRKIYKYVISPC
ncbi:Kinase superfamily protein [Salix suchowensis]|nr:Kinase superfamily protein [Salix suchowensis]